jgi:hypothetical protein
MHLKNSLVTHKSRLILAIVGGLLLISSSLYWWAVRPYVASKSCHHIALVNTGYNKDNVDLWTRNDTAQRDYMFIYEVCMHKEGINP